MALVQIRMPSARRARFADLIAISDLPQVRAASFDKEEGMISPPTTPPPALSPVPVIDGRNELERQRREARELQDRARVAVRRIGRSARMGNIIGFGVGLVYSYQRNKGKPLGSRFMGALGWSTLGSVVGMLAGGIVGARMLPVQSRPRRRVRPFVVPADPGMGEGGRQSNREGRAYRVRGRFE